MPAQLREHALGVQQRGSRVAVQDAKQRSFYAESLFCDVAAFTSERDVVAAVVGMGDDRANAWITAQDFKIRNGEPARVGVVVVDSERTVAVLGCKTYRLRKSYSISGISSRVGENSADAHVVNANKLLARFPPFAKYPGFCVFPQFQRFLFCVHCSAGCCPAKSSEPTRPRDGPRVAGARTVRGPAATPVTRFGR